MSRRGRSVFVLLLTAGVALLVLPNAAHLARAADPAKGTEPALTGSRPFVLTVLRPDGKVLPGVQVEFRSEPAIVAAQVREGRFLRSEPGAIFVKTNDKGRVVLDLPKNPDRFDVLIEMPGYAPYWARWDSEYHPEPVLAAFTAILNPAWSVGGIFIDVEGKPIQGAQITPRINYKHRPGDSRGSYFGSYVETDAQGAWHFDSVPASLDEVVVAINHPDFVPSQRAFTRAERKNRFETRSDGDRQGHR